MTTDPEGQQEQSFPPNASGSGGVDANVQGNMNVQGDVVARDKIVHINNVQRDTEQSSHIDLDSRLFLQIREILPSDHMRFVCETSYSGSFRRNMLQSLHNFLEYSHRPEWEFIDSDMEGLRMHLVESIEHFLNLIGRYTFVEKVDPEFSRVPYAHADYDLLASLQERAKDEEDFERLFEEQEQRADRWAHAIQDAAAQVWLSFTEFIRNGRRRLNA